MTRPSAQIILFDPPDPRRLRYLRTGYGSSTGESTSLLDRQDGYGIGSRRNPVVGLDRIIPLVRTRSILQARLNADSIQLNDVRGQQRDLHNMDSRTPSSGQITRKTNESTSRLTNLFAPFALMIRHLVWAASCSFSGMAGISMAISSSASEISSSISFQCGLANIDQSTS
jgi:hypothetical protein